MSDVTVVVVRNEFERLAVELAAETEDVIEDIAGKVADDMRTGTKSDRTAASVKVHRESSRRTTVTAGDLRSAFAAGFEEYGTVFEAAHPFATPAAENHRGEFKRRMSSIERRMKRGA